MSTKLKQILIIFTSLYAATTHPLAFFAEQHPLYHTLIEANINKNSAATLKNYTDAREAFGIALFDTVVEQVDTFHAILIRNVTRAHSQLVYWQYQDQHSFLHFLRKSPLKWFGQKSQKEEVHEHINALTSIIDHYHRTLGVLHQYMSRLYIATSKEECRLYAFRIMSLINSILKNTATGHAALYDASPTAHTKAFLDTLIQENKDLLIAYPRKNNILDAHKKPSHFVRNWIPYTISLGLGLYAIHLYQQHGNKLEAFYENTFNATKSFIISHAKEPIEKIINIFYGKEKEDSWSKNKEWCNNYIENLFQKSNDAIYSYLKDEHPELSSQQITDKVTAFKDSGIVPDEIKTDALSAKLDGYNLLASKGKILRTKEVNLIPGLENGIAQGLNRVVTVADTMVTENAMLLQILRMIPIYIAARGAYYSLSKCFNYLTKQTTWFYKPIKVQLLEIEKMLNNYQNKNDMLNAIDCGKIHYILLNLRKYAIYLPLTTQQQYMYDLDKLDSYTMQIQQKEKIIARMHRTYECLQDTFI